MDTVKILKFIGSNKKKILINFAYLVVAFIILIIQSFYLNSSSMYPDNAEYYFAPRLLFSPDFSKLYGTVSDWCWFCSRFNTAQFRSLPSLVFFYLPISIIPDFFIAYFIFLVISFVLNIFTVFYCIEIVKHFKNAMPDLKSISYFLSLFLCSFIQFSSYLQGQLSSLISFLLVNSMYQMLKGNERLGCLLVGISFAIKPTSYFIIIFMIIYSRTFKKALTRGFFIVLPNLINIVVFLVYPEMIRGFIYVNFTHNYYDNGIALPSISLTSFFTIFFRLANYKVYVLLAVAMPAFISIVLLGRKKPSIDRIVISYIFGSMLYFLCQYDVWASQLVFLLSFMIIFQLIYNDNCLVEYKGYWFLVIVCFIYDPIRVIYTLFSENVLIMIIYYCAAAVSTFSILVLFINSLLFLSRPPGSPRLSRRGSSLN